MWKRLDNWIDGYSENTRIKYKRYLSEYCDFMEIAKDIKGSEKFLSVDVSGAQIYVNHLKKQPAQKGRSALRADCVSLATVKEKCIVLSTIYKQTIILNLGEFNPFSKFKQEMRNVRGNDRRPHRLIPFNLVQKVIGHQFGDTYEGRRDRAIVALLFGGALRRSEAMGIRLCDVVENPKGLIELLLVKTKKQCSDSQLLPGWASVAIREYLKHRKNEGSKDMHPLITNYRNRLPVNDYVDPKTFYRWFKGIFLKAELEPLYSPHCARHTAITFLLEKGKSHRDIAKISRHSTVRSVENYDRMRHAKREEVLEDLDYKE